MRRIKQGALSPALTFTALDSNDDPIDLGDYSTITLAARLAGETMVRISGSVTVVGDGSTGQGSYEWTAGDTDNPPGVYEFELHGVRTDDSLPEIIPDYDFGEFEITDAVTPSTPIDDTMGGTVTVVTESTLDDSGTALSGVPGGAKITAYVENEPYAIAIAASDGNFSIGLTNDATYTLVAVKLGNPTWTRVVSV